MNQLKAKDGCCEEASVFSREVYIPCNQPATQVLYSSRDKRKYRMCEPCAHDNLKRGMVKLEANMTTKRPRVGHVNADHLWYGRESGSNAAFRDYKESGLQESAIVAVVRLDDVKVIMDELKLTKASLLSILEIGKRDMSNPKYDGYFQDARERLVKLEVFMESWFDDNL